MRTAFLFWWGLPGSSQYGHSRRWHLEPSLETQDTWLRAGPCLKKLPRFPRKGLCTVSGERPVVKTHLPRGPQKTGGSRFLGYQKDLAPLKSLFDLGG